MRRLFFIFLFVPFLAFTQTKDYKSFDKAVKYFNKGKNEKAKNLIFKLIKNDPDWYQPHLLMSSILKKEGSISAAAQYLLNVYDIDNVEDLEGIQKIARLFYTNGFYNEARRYFDIVWNLDSVNCMKEIPLFISNCNFAIKAIKDSSSFIAKNMGSEINSEFAEYLPTLSANNQLFFITRRLEYEDASTNEDFFVSIRENNKWSRVVRLDKPINSNNNEGALALSSDGQLMVFTGCDRRNGYGGCDLYFAFKNDKWSSVNNIGEHINSRWKDTQPCFSADGRYLYFVSNRPGGYGGLDIWKSKVTYSTYGTVRFSVPVNLGDVINTEYDEMSPFIHTNNLSLYFASNGHVGMGDYDLFLSKRKSTNNNWLKPTNLGYPINTWNIENSLVVANDGKTAYFASNKSGFGLEDIFVFDLPKNMQVDEISALELEIITQKIGEEVVLKNVTFASNSVEIEASSHLELDKLIAYLRKNPDIKIEIQGHTDNVGTETDNLILSEKRARTVYNYLKFQVENKLSYVGYGESRPLASNDSENGKKINRRTSFVIQ